MPAKIEIRDQTSFSVTLGDRSIVEVNKQKSHVPKCNATKQQKWQPTNVE